MADPVGPPVVPAVGPPLSPPVVLDGLTVRVGAGVLVERIGFTLGHGEIVVLEGPSGAGKSTIAAAMAGALPAGSSVHGGLLVRGRVGYLPQHAAQTLNPARRVGHAIAEIAALHGSPPPRRRPRRRRAWAAERVARVLAQVALPPAGGPAAVFGRRALGRRYPFEFSGGQRTRLALALVLAADPRVLVLDEPTAGLDRPSRDRLAEVLHGLRGTGAAILVVTHDASFAERVADRRLLLRKGRLVTGRPTDAPPPAPPTAPAPPTPPPPPAPPQPSARPEPRAPAGIPPAVRGGTVELRDATVRLRAATILSGVDLLIGAAQVVALVGPSGAGKSTLSRVLAGLTPLHRGVLTVDGERYPGLARRSRAQTAAVQYVWQEAGSSFEPSVPVLDQVARTAVRLRGLTRERARCEARELLARYGLTPAECGRRPAGLSGGQLRRVALARAVLAHPRLLICDEITTGLDPGLARHILDDLCAYRDARGASLLVVSHDLELVTPYADRIVTVEAGRVTGDVRPPSPVRTPGRSGASP